MPSSTDIRPDDPYALGTLTLLVSNKRRRLARVEAERDQVRTDLEDAEARLAEVRKALPTPQR